MQDQPSPDRSDQNLSGPVFEPLPPLWPVERALLMVLLGNRPGQLSSHELMREPRETPEVVEHAIDALVGAGLARRERGRVLATRAAVRFDELGV